MKTAGLYIHIPFCASKCAYCDFYSLPSTEFFSDYKAELIKEITAVSKCFDGIIDTVYIGGGTPSVFPLNYLSDIAQAVFNSFQCKISEFTVEVNPCSSADIEYYKDFGANRISLGVQSLDENVLRLIGRRHNRAQALEAVERAATHFDNVSADLILGITQEQKPSGDIAALKDCVKHISAYMLKIESGTPIAKMVTSGQYTPPGEDKCADLYDEAHTELQKYGLKRYEISNFARDGYESVHNMKYWRMQDYIGVGAAAHSYVGGMRYNNPPSLTEYLKGYHSGNNRQKKQHADALLETIMLGLRLENGLDISQINKTFSIDFKKVYAEQLAKLQPYLDITQNKIAIKPQYMLLENAIAVEFF